MAFDFPSSPTNGQVYTSGGASYVYNGYGWDIQATSNPANYVLKAGDTMTGNLTISKTTPSFILTKSAVAQHNQIVGAVGVGSSRWMMSVGDASPESGGNAGSDFTIHRYGDNGAYISVAFTINRATGNATVNGNLAANNLTAGGGDIYAAKTSTMGTYYFGSGTSKYLTYDGSSYTLGGGQFIVNAGAVWSQLSATVGYFQFGSSGTKYLNFDGTQFNLAGGNLIVSSPIVVNAAGTSSQLNQSGDAFNLINTNNSNTANAHVQYNRVVNDACWTYATLNSAANAWTYYITGAGNSNQYGNFVIYGTGRGYQPGAGAWLDTSDIRIKNVLGKYEHGLDEILQLEPIRYTFKGNDTVDPPSHVGKGLEVPEHLIDVPLEAPYPNSAHYAAASKAKEFIGLVAQAVEGVMPEMVTMREGMIDGKSVTDLRDLDNSALIYALVNAVKTLTARIEALEAVT